MISKDSSWYPDNFCLEIGRFVVVFADVEGVAGELIEIRSRNLQNPTSQAFRASGSQLLKELKKCNKSEEFLRICSDLESLTEYRNMLMHGEWVFHDDQRAMLFKRKFDKSTKSPGYDHAPLVRPQDIAFHANRLRHIESALGTYLAHEMGISK